jgi:hypothetical protein
MNTPVKNIILFCLALAGSARGNPPSSPSDPPAGGPSNYAALSPAARLGLKFSPPAKEEESSVVVPRSPSAVFPDPVAPGTVLLPTFVITERRVKLTEKSVLSDKGRLEIAEKQCLTPLYRVTFGPLAQIATYYFDFLSILGGWHPNELEARELYREEERLRMLSEMDSLIRLETIDRPKGTKEFKRIQFGAQTLSR